MANFSFNKVILGGRLTSDVELKQTTSGVSVCSFGIAVNRKYAKDGEQQADFINCQAWRGTAEFISKYFRKGSSLCVTGSIQVRKWQDNQGNNRYATEVVVDEAMFVDSRNEGGAAPASYTTDAYSAPAFSPNPGSEPSFENHNTDDDFPF